MASRSRLGKGLGALFPDIPQVNEESKSSAASVKEDVPNASDTKHRGTKRSTSLERTSKSSSSRGTKTSGSSSKRKTASESRSTASENVSRETLESVSTSETSGNVSDEAVDTERLLSPKFYSTAKNVEKSGKSTRQKKQARSKRSSVPHLDELSHPSDLFFGESVPAIEQSWPAGIARDHSSEKGIEPASSEEESRNAGKDSKATRNDNIAAQNVDVSRETSTSNDDKGNGRVAESTQKPDGSASLETISAENPDRGIEKSSKEEGLQPVKGAYLTSLKVDDISPNAHQPRSIFDEDELVELSHSIQEVGVLQPIVVRQRSVEEVENDRQKPYELIMGERRWRASSLANIEEIPAIVKTTPDDQMLRDALLENLHRVALNPLEEAAAYQQMIQEFGLTQEQLSQSISKSRPQIANMLRLLQLPGVVQKKVASGVISAGHARALLALSTQEEMESLANRIIAEGLSVRSTEEIVSMTIHRPETQKTARQNRSNIWTDSEVRNSLEDRFETKVSIKGSQKKGRIEIVFSSPEDMQRIVDMLLPAAQNNSDKQDGWVYSVR